MNLLTETLEVLRENGKSLTDVSWIGCEQFKIPTSDFCRLADIEYDNWYGSTEVPEDLVIVGTDWFMGRVNEDGNEWWEFRVLSMPEETKEVPRLLNSRSGETLTDILEEPNELDNEE